MRILKVIFLLTIFSYCVCLHSSTAQWSLQTSGINSSLYSVHFAETYTVDWNASYFPSGVYFYRLQTDGYTKTKRITLIK